ncbi:toll/interleukin-1 receptor domain-containing protein [Eubacterium sp. MSJ-13]|uniref:toll/interleukin-1 receptor domain-containing protein n=1 Tax=Eubacterium sp. MSJ-13 TaxID=2841513 RepID=UPI001C119104|nr:toll/interleukin-1 receptor domain-containing protein [Eubacterium sp. MSJ-13]MBU5477616.1 toll/interleukin-1 receptor domain-containing protein [Eubacterium sp. MSJ-13]
MDKKIKVFISYGNPEIGICKKIYNYLKNKLNYDVWYDKESIDFDDNWREKIYEGIKSSDVVLACLSEYSTRKHGVCLDELRIAIAVKVQLINVNS